MADRSDSKDDEKRTSRARRLGGFFSRRGGVHKSYETINRGADFISDIGATLRPKKMDPKGYRGRHPDGGVERFKQMSDGLSDAELNDQLRAWVTQRVVFQYAALIAFILMPIGFIFLGITYYMVVGLFLLCIFCILRAFRADYSAWTIEQGRFAGFHEYLTDTLPRNMHVILPGQKGPRS